jgi:hypothetical protein
MVFSFILCYINNALPEILGLISTKGEGDSSRFRGTVDEPTHLVLCRDNQWQGLKKPQQAVF